MRMSRGQQTCHSQQCKPWDDGVRSWGGGGGGYLSTKNSTPSENIFQIHRLNNDSQRHIKAARIHPQVSREMYQRMFWAGNLLCTQGWRTRETMGMWAGIGGFLPMCERLPRSPGGWNCSVSELPSLAGVLAGGSWVKRVQVPGTSVCYFLTADCESTVISKQKFLSLF